jgi:hypothetical protein
MVVIRLSSRAFGWLSPVEPAGFDNRKTPMTTSAFCANINEIRKPAQYDTQNDAVSRNIDHDNQLRGVSRSDGGAIKRRFACYFDEEIGNACLLLR